MYELNKKTISTLIISILMLSMALAAIPASAYLAPSPAPSIYLGPKLEASGTGASATWADDPVTGGTQGKVAKLIQPGTDALMYAYVRVYPASTITLSTLTALNMPTFKYYMGAGTYPPALELLFEDPSSNGHVEVTIFAYPSGGTGTNWPTASGTWYDTGVSPYKLTMNNFATSEGFDGTVDLEIVTGSNSLTDLRDDIIALASTAGSWVLTRVTPQVGWQQVGAQTVYIDDIKVGSVTYSMSSRVDTDGNTVGSKVFVSGSVLTLGAQIKFYWDSVTAWDGTRGYIGETFAVGTSYSYEITIPEGIAGIHNVIAKDMETLVSKAASITIKPEIDLSPGSGIILDTITVTGTGYGGTDTITITSSTIPIVQIPTVITTSALGSFTATFVVPAGTTTGTVYTATGTAPVVFATHSLTIGPVITLTPSKGLPGTTVTVAGRGFTGSSTVDITSGVYLLVNDYPTDSSGAFTTTITIPTVSDYDYIVTATDAASITAHAHFTVTGVTIIKISPKSGLAGIAATVTGDWFTKDKTVTVYFDDVSLGTTTAGSSAPYSITKSITIPTGATLGAHTIKAMDSTGVYATATFTVVTRVTVIETRSATYMPGDTLSFNIISSVDFRVVGSDDLVIKIYGPDGYLFWSVNWSATLDDITEKYVVPYSAQTVASGHLTLPSDANVGLWKWNATYYYADVVAKVVKQGSFTVKAVTAGVIDEKITALEQSINLLGVQILAAQTAAQAAQTAATTAGTKATAAETAAKAAQTAADAAGTKATAAETAAKAALTAAQAATTAAQGAKTSADLATTSANAAKASADAAKAATDGLTTLVYVAIGASAIAALAAIFAVMQISKKIA